MISVRWTHKGGRGSPCWAHRCHHLTSGGSPRGLDLGSGVCAVVCVCSECTTGYAAQAGCRELPEVRVSIPTLQPKLIELWLTTQTHAPPAAMSTAMGGDGLSEVRSPSPMFRASRSVLHARAPPEGSLLRRLSSGSSVPGNGSLHSAGMDATEPGPRWFSWAAAVLTAPWSVDGRGPLEDALPSL